MEHDYTSSTSLTLSQADQHYLSATRRWTSFLAIVGFVMTGFIVLMGLGVGLFASSMPGQMKGMGFMGIFYVLIAALYFFPCLYLMRFSSRMNTALLHNDQQALTQALANHKSFYKFIGVLMIITLALYALGIAVAMTIGLGRLVG
ncbi:hypothetical protein F0P96_05445 [Hymenobacter busanensis]|uniref:Uncharacterized protein n=1 Tax=Hymenobacter busanensis TaxID=2607656 RepID=A0A7L5A294_9BACT|nr:DUF5362 family protein [Hymenobacter busanensis]KAA9338283.1 hypothetical protein F0P96_05445 [Hymenobacter busanensis]QHJ09293.1 hypothetical protein GUY19_19165 [Hymenobacter busanensis]